MDAYSTIPGNTRGISGQNVDWRQHDSVLAIFARC